MKKLKLFIVTVLIANSGYCQSQLLGQAIDIITAKPIKGAHVTVIGKSIEATTDALGQFYLILNMSDSILIECNGYYSKKIQISNLDKLLVKLENSFPIYVFVDEPAEFPGGMPKFYEYVNSNFKYPSKKQKHGKIFVRIAIDTTGFIMPNETKIMKANNENLPSGIHDTYDPEVIRVVNSSPAWTSARQRGKKVRLEMILPIIF